MKILITGGCGYVARILIEELESSPQGHSLVLLDRTPPSHATTFNPEGGERNESPFKTEWPFVQAELLDAAAMQEALTGVDAVIHLAAAVTGLPEHGIEIFQSNALGTFILLDAAHKAGVKRLLCASSINTFGTFFWRLSGKPVEYSALPLDETFPPVPEDPYSLSKLVNEETCAAFSRAYGMTTAAFRFAGVWNDKLYNETQEQGMKPTEAWSDFLYQWVHVRDIARGIRQALECETLPTHGVYTMGAADTIAPEPTEEILKRFRPDLLQQLKKPLPGRAPLLSIDKAKATFGYAPQYRMGE